MPTNSDDPTRDEGFFIGGDLKPINPTSTPPANPTPAERFPWDDFLSPKQVSPPTGPSTPPINEASPIPETLPTFGTSPIAGAKPVPAAPLVAVTLAKVQALTQLYLKHYLESEQNLMSQAINVTQADQVYAMMTMDYRAIQSKNLARINFVQHVLGEMKVWKAQLDQISKLSGADQPETSALLSDASNRTQQAIEAWTDGRQKCIDAMKSVASSVNDLQGVLGNIATGISDSTRAQISQNENINSQFLSMFEQ